MSLSHVGRAIQFIAGARKTTATQIGANGGVSQVVISRASNGSRLETRTLKALCNSQPDGRDNLEILIGHLRDEIERAGHSTSEIEITADTSRIADDLRVLLDEAKHDEQLRGMLRQLAAFVRTHPLQQSIAMAAEDPAPYGQSSATLIARIETDMDRKVTAVTPAFTELCGHTREEILGHNIGQVLQGPDTSPTTVSALHAALAKREPIRVQITNYRKDGSPYSIDLSITPTTTGFSGEARLIK